MIVFAHVSRVGYKAGLVLSKVSLCGRCSLLSCLMASLSGCIIVESEAPKLRNVSSAGSVAVAVAGFISETVDVNPTFGAATAFHSGSGTLNGNAFNYGGSSATAVSGFTMSRRETGVMCGQARNMLADMGFAVMSTNPTYIVSGTYYGPCTDWRLWYADAAVDILTLTFCLNGRTKSSCEIRVFERNSGRMVKRIAVDDSYQFTSFSLLPLYGHLFVPRIYHNNLYPFCTQRVTIKAVNEVAGWLEGQGGPVTK